MAFGWQSQRPELYRSNLENRSEWVNYGHDCAIIGHGSNKNGDIREWNFNLMGLTTHPGSFVFHKYYRHWSLLVLYSVPQNVKTDSTRNKKSLIKKKFLRCGRVREEHNCEADENHSRERLHLGGLQAVQAGRLQQHHPGELCRVQHLDSKNTLLLFFQLQKQKKFML